jgi:hypothetical protein
MSGSDWCGEWRSEVAVSVVRVPRRAVACVSLVKWGCPCDERDALLLLQDQTELALTGKQVEIQQLPAYVEHYLSVVARKQLNERSRD